MPGAGGGDPAPEIETPEVLATQGWERLTLTIDSTRTPADEWEECEIMEDPEGGLLLVKDWHWPGGDGRPHRAARERITREQARAFIVQACIPEAFRPDFEVAARMNAAAEIVRKAFHSFACASLAT